MAFFFQGKLCVGVIFLVFSSNAVRNPLKKKLSQNEPKVFPPKHKLISAHSMIN